MPLTERAQAALDEFQDQKQPFEQMNRAIKLIRNALNEICNTDEFVIAPAGRATIHSFRDSYATFLVSEGMSLYQVSKLLGHAGMSMSAKYAHLEHNAVSDEALKILEGRNREAAPST